MAFKRAEDYKYYLYISTSKTRMLYEQLSATTGRKRTIEWSVKLPIVSLKRGATKEEKPNREEMLKRVLERLEATGQLGTLKNPKSFIRDVFPVRWGFFNDCRTRPDDEPALVYFGGFHNDLLLGMGGSSYHVVGHQGATSTWSRSATPTLARWLLSGLHEGKRPKVRGDMREEEDQVFQGMAVAQHYLRPPTQRVEFVAKTIAIGEVSGMDSFIGVKTARAILATPLYVAQLEPFRDNQLWGLSEGDWLLDEDDQQPRKLLAAPREKTVDVRPLRSSGRKTSGES